MTDGDTERSWQTVWSSRTVEPASGTTIAALLVADGYDTPFSRVEPAVWIDNVRRWAARLGIEAGTSVYEVGCGAGAFLAPLQELGARVGGCDLSQALVELAHGALPGAELRVTDAAAVSPSPTYDVVVSKGVFPYFPDLDYARLAVERMVAKARRAVAIIDIPDAQRRAEEVARRAGLYGGDEEYRDRYEGLEHLAYDRRWFEELFGNLGIDNVWTGEDELEGYANALTRFFVVATRREPSTTSPAGPQS
jgi:SAM-dependent methyltransferase